MHGKDLSGEMSHGNEEHVTGNWKKGNPCCKLARNLAEFCSSVLQKVEPASDENGYLAELNSKKIIEGGAWFLLSICSKM